MSPGIMPGIEHLQIVTSVASASSSGGCWNLTPARECPFKVCELSVSPRDSRADQRSRCPAAAEVSPPAGEIRSSAREGLD
ncbi:hypothetical protein FKM82_017531 [Ascaphus truei]